MEWVGLSGQQSLGRYVPEYTWSRDFTADTETRLGNSLFVYLAALAGQPQSLR